MSIVFFILRLAVLIAAALWIRSLFRRGFAAWSIAGMIRGIGVALALTTATAVMYLGRDVLINPMTRLTAAMIAGVVMIGIFTWSHRMLRLRRAPQSTRGPMLPRRIDRALCMATSLAILLAVWLVLDLMSRLESIGESGHGDTPHAAHARLDLAPVRTAAGYEYDGSESSAAQLAQMQGRFLAGIRRSVESSRQLVYESTGMDLLVMQLQAFRRLLDLEDAERNWILNNHPEIVALLGHPVMSRAVRSDRIAELIDRLGGGSIAAIYALGRDPDIQALLEDDQVYMLVQSLDLIEMMEQVDQYRAAKVRGR